MATLTGQTIAASYEQILHVDRDGGGNTSTLVNIKDGDNGTTFCASMTDASTAKAILSIDGSHANGTALYIDNSAGDGDVSLEWQLSGTTTWLMGIEDGDSDSLKICHDSTMGTDERLSFLTASTVFNEDSGDIDFRVESNTGTHAIFVDAGTPEVVINDDSIDMNFRVEGNGDANLLFCDAGNDRVGIGTASPDCLLELEQDASRSDLTGTTKGILNLNSGMDDDSNDVTAITFNSRDDQTAKPACIIGSQLTTSGSNLFFGTSNVYSSGVTNTALFIRYDGNVGIGVADPQALLHVNDGVATSENAGILLLSNFDETFGDTQALGQIHFGGTRNNTHWGVGAIISAEAAEAWDADNEYGADLMFRTAAIGASSTSIRMTILSDGKVGIGTDAPTQFLHVEEAAANDQICILRNTTGTTPYGIGIDFSSAHPNDTTRSFIYCEDDVEPKFIAYSDGSVGSAPNTYGAISDERVKQDIRDANSQWDDIKAIKVRNFKQKSAVSQYGNNAWEQIGVIAQEVEAAGMDKLISHHPPDEFQIENCDIDANDTVKGMKYSILYMKAVKALQEAMARIESLEAKVTALENA